MEVVYVISYIVTEKGVYAVKARPALGIQSYTVKVSSSFTMNSCDLKFAVVNRLPEAYMMSANPFIKSGMQIYISTSVL